LSVKVDGTEGVRNIEYLWTVINNINDETEEVNARIPAANKADYCLQTTFGSKQIHWKNKIRLHKTLIKPVLGYGSVTWTAKQMAVHMLCTIERKY
jgi:hypothetical protein